MFIQLRYNHNSDHIYYHRGAGECDFIVTDESNQPLRAIQVCHQLTDENFQREMDGLTEAMKRFNLSEGLIITLDEKDEFATESGTVKVVRAWEIFQ